MSRRQILARASARNPLPEGTLAVGAGLLVAGVTAYGFLVLSARAVGAEAYAALTAVWFAVFLGGPGFFMPVEQEVGRALSARRARGLGGGPLIRRAAAAAGGLAAVLVAAGLATSPTLVRSLFDDDWLLLAGFLLGLVGYCGSHLGRGTLSGNRRFRPYGLLVGAEGGVRLLMCVALAVAGVEAVGPYGLAIGLAPFVALAIALRNQRGLVSPGPDAPWSELSEALGWLLAGSVFAQLLVNAGPLAVKLLATDAQNELAGRFGAGLVIARIPVFLFQAVQAALLPKLAGLATSGRHADFRTGLFRLLVTVGVIGVVATSTAFAIGPAVVRLLFGAEFDLGRRDLGLLALAASIYILAMSLAQALIALQSHARAAFGWLCGISAFALVTATLRDLLLRVEAGLVAGSAVALVVMAVLLRGRMASGVPDSIEPLVHAIETEPVEP